MPADAPSVAEWPSWADNLAASRALGLTCIAAEPGRVRLTLSRSLIPLNPNGGLHGGMIAAVIDQAMGIVAPTALDNGRLAVTATLSVEYYQPAFLPLELDAQVLHAGRTHVFVRVDVRDRSGTVRASAHATMVSQQFVGLAPGGTTSGAAAP